MIALQFGRFLETGRPSSEFDLVGRKLPTEETRFNRRAILTDLAGARIYLLDHHAANYLDSLRMDVQGMPWETRDELEIQSYVRDVEFPRELVWVEYDTRQLWMDRVARGLTTMAGLDLRHFSQRGFLFDNRSENLMTVQLNNGTTDRSCFEPLANFGCTKMTLALLDHLTHRRHILETDYDSFHSKNISTAASATKKRRRRHIA